MPGLSNKPKSGPSPEENPKDVQEVLTQSQDLLTILDIGLNTETELQEWDATLARAFKPVEKPTASNTVEPTETKVQFLERDYVRITEEENMCLRVMQLALNVGKELPEGQIIDSAYSAIILERMAHLVSLKESYQSIQKNQKKEQSKMPAYLAIFIEELAEEGVEGFMPLRKEWSTSWMRTLDKTTQNTILDSSHKVRMRLLRAGAKNVPELSYIGRGPAGKFMKEVIKGATPDSYFTIMLMAYYIHSSNDKMAAAMQFGSFLLLSGMSNAVMVTVEGILQKKLGESALLARIPGHPLAKITVAIGLAFGVDKMIGFDNIVKWVEKRINPVGWDAAGNVADMMFGSALIGHTGEIARITGLMGVDPQHEQFEFLSKRLMMANYEKGTPLGSEFAHTIKMWDEYAKEAIEDTRSGRGWKMQNKVQAALYESCLIDNGPGGRSGWANRQAVVFYNQVEALRGLETSLTEELKKEQIVSSFGMDLADASATANDTEGDVIIRWLLHHSTKYQKIQNGIKSISDPERQKDLQNQFDGCVERAKTIANLRSMYIHLGVFNESWIKSRKLGKHKLLPLIVEEGIISTIVLAAKRDELLQFKGESRNAASHHGHESAMALTEPNNIDIMDTILSVEGWRKMFSREMAEDEREAQKWIDQRNALSQMAQAAGKILSTEEYNKAMAQLRKEILTINDRRTAYEKYMALRAIQRKLSERVSAAASERSGLQEAPNIIREKLKIPEWRKSFVTFDRVYNSPPDAEVAKRLHQAFNIDKNSDRFGKESDPGSHKITYYTYVNTGRGSQTMSVTRFFCPGTDRKNWYVETQSSERSVGFGTDHRFDNSQRREIPLSEWIERHKRLLQTSQGAKTQLAQALDGIETLRHKEYLEEIESAKREAQAKKEATKRAALETEKFVKTDWDENGALDYCMLYKDSIISTPIPREGASWQAVKTGEYWIETNPVIIKQILPNGRTITFTRSDLRSMNPDSFLTDEEKKTLAKSHQQKLISERISMVYHALATPLENDDRATIVRLVGMVPAKAYRPGSFASNFYNPYNCRLELIKDLLPLYRAANPKRRWSFLNELRVHLQSNKTVTKSSVKKIVKWYKEHPYN